MESSGFPIQKTNRSLTEVSNTAEQRRVPDRPVELPQVDVAAAPAYYTLADCWHIIVRHKTTLLRFALVGLVGAILISLLQTPLYRARTSVEIQDFNENFLAIKSVDPANSAGSYTTPESYMGTQVKILQSESLLERVIGKLSLYETLPATGWRELGSRVRRKLGLSTPSSGPPPTEALIRQAERNLTVRVPARTRLLEVLYESPDPKLASDFANTLVTEFVEQSQEMRWKSTQRTAEWLTSHLAEMKLKLEQSEAQLQDYARSSGMTLTSEKDNIAEIRLKELQEELSKAQADRVARQASYEESIGKPADSLPEMLEHLTLRDYRLKLTDLQRQLVELSATLTPTHYKVQRVQAQIAELESAMQIERVNVLHRIGNEYLAARRRERLLAQVYADQEKIVADQSNKAIHYSMLKREVDSSRQLYESMQQRVKEASLATAMRASNVLVVDPAKPPLFPYKPNMAMNVAWGLLSAVSFGLGFVMFRERFDRRIRAPGDAQVYLNLPELGVVPLAQLPSSRHISDGLHARPTLTLSSGRERVSSLGDCPELATWQCKTSVVAECVRTTLISILLPDQNGGLPRLLVITSPSPGDGKTTVVSNLSIAMAEIRRKVVLIDGDLRRPRLHKVFGVPNDSGLGNVLRAGTSLETTPIMNLLCKTKISGLYLLPGGSSPISPSILLNSPRMSALLDCLRREFDMVLVDAPPVIHLADARVLGRLADGVILVIRSGQTTPESAINACQGFVEDGTRVLGTVLNSWDPKTSRYHGYGSYGDYQAYGG